MEAANCIAKWSYLAALGGLFELIGFALVSFWAARRISLDRQATDKENAAEIYDVSASSLRERRDGIQESLMRQDVTGAAYKDAERAETKQIGFHEKKAVASRSQARELRKQGSELEIRSLVTGGIFLLFGTLLQIVGSWP